jgi:hypothetical protein
VFSLFTSLSRLSSFLLDFDFFLLFAGAFYSPLQLLVQLKPFLARGNCFSFFYYGWGLLNLGEGVENFFFPAAILVF